MPDGGLALTLARVELSITPARLHWAVGLPVAPEQPLHGVQRRYRVKRRRPPSLRRAALIRRAEFGMPGEPLGSKVDAIGKHLCRVPRRKRSGEEVTLSYPASQIHEYLYLIHRLHAFGYCPHAHSPG